MASDSEGMREYMCAPWSEPHGLAQPWSHAWLEWPAAHAPPALRHPRTAAWLEAAMARPSFRATARPEDKLIALYERFLAVDYSFGGMNRN